MSAVAMRMWDSWIKRLKDVEGKTEKHKLVCGEEKSQPSELSEGKTDRPH